MQAVQAILQTSARCRGGAKSAMRLRARAAWCSERLPRLLLLIAGVAAAVATASLISTIRQDIANGRYLTQSALRARPTAPPDASPSSLMLTDRSTGFSPGGYTIWHVGPDDASIFADAAAWEYGEASVELLLADNTRGYHHVLRFHHQRAGGSRRVASVFLVEAGRTAIALPRGIYNVELVTRPAVAANHAASVLTSPGRHAGVIDLTRPTSSYRLGPMLLIADYRQMTFIPGVRAGPS